MHLKIDLPEKSLLQIYLPLVYEFTNEDSPLFYRSVWKNLQDNFNAVVSDEEIVQLNDTILQIESEGLGIEVNGLKYNFRQSFELVTNAGYFRHVEKHLREYAELKNVDWAPEILWHNTCCFALNVFEIVSRIFDLVLKIESSEEFSDHFKEKDVIRKRCIYCLSETEQFNSEEHIIPESLAGDEVFLEKGVVCDRCNNGVCSELDAYLIEFEPIAFMRVQHGHSSKKGAFPKANFQNMKMDRTDHRNILITAKDKTGVPTDKEDIGNGMFRMKLNFTGKRVDWGKIARSIYKIGLGFVALDLGHDVALNEKYNISRDFVLNGGKFENYLLVSFHCKPSNQIFAHLDTRFGGTGFLIFIFGMVFMINLEEEPKLGVYNSSENPPDELFETMEFKRLSLFEDKDFEPLGEINSIS